MMWNVVRRGCLPWLFLSAAVVLAQESAPPPLERCVLGGSGFVAARCGTLEVFEDRLRGTGRRIPIRFAVIPSTADTPAPEPILLLPGGPGQASVALMATRAWTSPLRSTHEFLLIDQRGTGESNPLSCQPGSDSDLQAYLGNPFKNLWAFEVCRDLLSQRADLRLYTTPLALDDVADVIRALGYERVNLDGGSWGTRNARMMMARHPELVRAVVMRGPMPISVKGPLHHALSTQEALERTLADCAAEPRCAQAYPDPGRQLAAVLAVLEAEPARTSIPFRAFARPTSSSVFITRAAFAEFLRRRLYTAEGGREIPYFIHEAAAGRFSEMAARRYRGSLAIWNGLQFGTLLSVSCPEDVARITEHEIEPLVRNTLLGDVRVRGQIAACALWPTGDIEGDYWTPPTSDIPTLIFAGTHDPVTPPKWAHEMARGLGHARVIEVPGGHGLLTARGCIDAIVAAFIRGGSPRGPDTECIADTAMPRFRLP